MLVISTRVGISFYPVESENSVHRKSISSYFKGWNLVVFCSKTKFPVIIIILFSI